LKINSSNKQYERSSNNTWRRYFNKKNTESSAISKLRTGIKRNSEQIKSPKYQFQKHHKSFKKYSGDRAREYKEKKDFERPKNDPLLASRLRKI